MKRYLIPQMIHEWRSNLWLIIELALVSGIVSYLALSLYQNLQDIWKPLGFDYENVYTLSMRLISPESPVISEAEGDSDNSVWHDSQNMLARLRSNPHVEAVAIGQNIIPFQLNYQGNAYNIEGQPDSVTYNGNLRYASPDIVRILRLQAMTDISAKDLEDRLANGEGLIAPNNLDGISESTPEDAFALVGKNLQMRRENDTANIKVGAVIPIISRTGYEFRNQGMMLFPMDESEFQATTDGTDIILRIKDGEALQFEEQFRNDPALRRNGNVILHDLQSLAARRLLTERTYDMQVRLTIAMISFFLLIILLGLLGSFWYRIQQRSGEIALRKVAGATSGDIFRRVLSEASMLLLCGFLLGVALFLLFLYIIVENPHNREVWKLALIGIGIAYVILQLIVFIGVSLPARRAMSLQPAIALKEE